jgi:hypothetical protein
MTSASCASFFSSRASSLCSRARATVAVCPSTFDWARFFASKAVASASTASSWASWASSLSSFAFVAEANLFSAISIRSIKSS